MPSLVACMSCIYICLLTFPNYFLNYIYTQSHFPYVVARTISPFVIFCFAWSIRLRAIILSSSLYKGIQIPYACYKAWSFATNAIDLEMCLDLSFLFSFVAFLLMNVYYVCSVLSLCLFPCLPTFLLPTLAKLLPYQYWIVSCILQNLNVFTLLPF